MDCLRAHIPLFNMLKFALIAACAVQLAAAADPKIFATADGSLVAEDKSGKVCVCSICAPQRFCHRFPVKGHP